MPSISGGYKPILKPASNIYASSTRRSDSQQRRDAMFSKDDKFNPGSTPKYKSPEHMSSLKMQDEAYKYNMDRYRALGR